MLVDILGGCTLSFSLVRASLFQTFIIVFYLVGCDVVQATVELRVLLKNEEISVGRKTLRVVL